MMTIRTMILDIANECLAECNINDQLGAMQEVSPTLTAQHRALLLECAQLGHAYARTSALALCATPVPLVAR